MGFKDKLMGIINPSSIEGDYNGAEDDLYGVGDDDYYGENYDEPENRAQTYQMNYQQPMSQGQSGQSASMSINANALELKVVRPEKFQNVTQIADHLLNRRTVVLNLEATNKETSKRIIDFLSGVAYSINGQLKKVANDTYVITPSNIDVSNDQAAAAEQQASVEREKEEEGGEYYNGI